MAREAQRKADEAAANKAKTLSGGGGSYSHRAASFVNWKGATSMLKHAAADSFTSSTLFDDSADFAVGAVRIEKIDVFCMPEGPFDTPVGLQVTYVFASGARRQMAVRGMQAGARTMTLAEDKFLAAVELGIFMQHGEKGLGMTFIKLTSSDGSTLECGTSGFAHGSSKVSRNAASRNAVAFFKGYVSEQKRVVALEVMEAPRVTVKAMEDALAKANADAAPVG